MGENAAQKDSSDRQRDGEIVNPPNGAPTGENTDGQIVNPGMAADPDDGVGDAGDQANDMRFAQEQELIGEQTRGVFPDDEPQVPADEPEMDEAMGDVDQGSSNAQPEDSGAE